MKEDHYKEDHHFESIPGGKRYKVCDVSGCGDPAAFKVEGYYSYTYRCKNHKYGPLVVDRSENESISQSSE